MEEYKNILANKFMRDTNYIIIKDTDDLEELERQWELFQSSLTVRQQRLSDDRSIQIWDMTNQQHYEALKSILMKDLQDKLGIDDNEPTSIEYEPDDDEKIDDSEITNFVNMSFDDFNIPDDDNEISEPMTEDTIIPKDEKVPFKAYSTDHIKDNQAAQYEIDSNINIIGGLKGVTADQLMADLEKQFRAWNSQNQDHRKKSDDKCREIYGMSNIDRYNMLKGKLTTNIQVKKPEDMKPNIDNDVNSSEEALGEFVSEVYKNMQAINEAEYEANKQHRRFNDTPYFTPYEMIDMGVTQNDYFYSPQPDNDGLVTGVKVPTWFDNYKDMCMDHIFEDYTKAWIDTLNNLYSDFEQIKESGDEDKILARKQSILNLGWNPNIPFTKHNRQLAAKRVNKLLDKGNPMNIFVNLDKSVPDESLEDEPVVENAAKDTHKAVYLVFVQGKTPVLSTTIKKVTNSEYSHIGISFSPDLTQIHSYNSTPPNPGIKTESLGTYKNNVITVMAFYAPNDIWQNMKDSLMDYYIHTRTTVYDWGIIFNKLFKKNARALDDKYHQVCSTFVDSILKAGQIDLGTNSNIPDPGQIFTAVKTMPNKIIEVYTGPANSYNPVVIEKKMTKLLKKGFAAINESALPNGITLRNATKDDADNMFEWEMASVDKSIRSDPKVIKYMEQDVQDSIKDTKMIMTGDKTIGMFTTCMLNTGYWYIGEIYIIPEYRNKGIGSALIDEEIKHHDKIKLQVAQSNTKAMKLYKSYGFEITETNDKAKMYVMTYDKNKSMNEAVSDLPSTESNDIHHNIEDWETGECNLLWITGLSGSGKSTLSTDAVSTYNAEHVELDNLQRAKMENWDTTGSKLLDDYIKSKGGLSKIFTYCNKLEKIAWKDIVSSEECAKQFDNLFNYIMSYAKANPKRRFIVEGVQIAMCSKDSTINFIAKYPVIIKMNGPLKTEFRREVRTVKYGIDNDKGFADICKTVFKRHTAWLKGDMYLDDWKELNYFRKGIGESASVLNEVKQFPVEFDQDGDLIIYKCRIGSISYGDEVADCVKLLETYRNTNNIEGMKYELAKLWFINESIEKRLKRKLSNDEYKVLIDTRATCLNVFKLNLEYVSKAEKGFNFSDYYNSTPFSDNSIKITANTLKYSMRAIASLL